MVLFEESALKIVLRIIFVSAKGMSKELPFQNLKAYINIQKVVNGTEANKFVRNPDQ